MQLSCVSLLTSALVFVLCPCCIICAVIIVKFECVSIAQHNCYIYTCTHVHVHCSVIVHTGNHLSLSHILSPPLSSRSFSLPPHSTCSSPFVLLPNISPLHPLLVSNFTTVHVHPPSLPTRLTALPLGYELMTSPYGV